MPDDHLPFDLGDDDLRVQREGWVYYVRAVRRGESLAGGGVHGLEELLATVVFVVLFGRVLERWQERRPWKVGVIRMSGDRWGANGVGRIRVVHQELVTAAVVPTSRLAGLAAGVRAGEPAEPARR